MIAEEALCVGAFFFWGVIGTTVYLLESLVEAKAIIILYQTETPDGMKLSSFQAKPT